jgi:hypothetical protein
MTRRLFDGLDHIRDSVEELENLSDINLRLHLAWILSDIIAELAALHRQVEILHESD